jgi:hypothetical protein
VDLGCEGLSGGGVEIYIMKDNVADCSEFE